MHFNAHCSDLFILFYGPVFWMWNFPTDSCAGILGPQPEVLHWRLWDLKEGSYRVVHEQQALKFMCTIFYELFLTQQVMKSWNSMLPLLKKSMSKPPYLPLPVKLKSVDPWTQILPSNHFSHIFTTIIRKVNNMMVSFLPGLFFNSSGTVNRFPLYR